LEQGDIIKINITQVKTLIQGGECLEEIQQRLKYLQMLLLECLLKESEKIISKFDLF